MTTPQVAPATDETRPGTEELEVLLVELLRLREYMLKQADDLASLTAPVDPAYCMSAVNLAHNLGLRQHDVRLSQEALAAVGLSSLGRCEGYALASVDAVVRALYALLDRTEPAPSGPLAVSSADGRARLEANTTALLGPQPDERSVRIMVTLPSEAATDYGLNAFSSCAAGQRHGLRPHQLRS